MTRYKWEGAGTVLPDGHRIFETHDNGHGEAAWAIVDQSGRTPEQSADGVLFLDRSRPLNASTRHAPTVPLVAESGERRSTTTDTPTLLHLAQQFRWTIADEVRGRYFNVR